MPFRAEWWGIVWTTLRVTLPSASISALLGASLGLSLERARFRGKRWVVRIVRTLMGAPPVVVGLVVYLLFMRRGALGFFDLLFTVPAMIVAQVLVIAPIVCGMVHSAAEQKAQAIRAFAASMGANRPQTRRLLVRELRADVYFAALTGFGRAMSEVGAVMIVGGNIQGKTRTMTTSIALLRNRGEYGDAIAMGALLLLIAFAIQWGADALRRGDGGFDENL